MSTIFAVGDNTIDTYTGHQAGSYVGGNALNVAVQLSRLGDTAAYFGAVAADDAGRRISMALELEGVDITGLHELAGRTAGTLIGVAESGERTLLEEQYGVSAIYYPSKIELERLHNADAVHIGMITDAERLRNELRGSAALLSQDCAVSKGFSGLDVAFGSVGPDRRAAKQMAQTALAEGARLAVVTCGAAGSVAFDGTDWFEIAAIATKIIDTTGAGDSYIAGFLSARAKGAGVRESMITGTESAARTCGHVGAWPQ
ncbi:MAG: PfkB family carbohydrate kinase [Actinomycetes bacterium]